MTELKEAAIFIADSHYPHHGDAFFDLLLAIDSQKLNPPQIFFMGDNFDLLFGHNRYILEKNREVLALLQNISKRISCYYFEGNHDFCLKDIFIDMQVFSREEQPITFVLNTQKVALAHGDKYATGWGYNVYSKILRNVITLKLLRPFGKSIIDDRMQKLSKKNICHVFHGFEKRVEEILKDYQKVDLVIEGHFHQGKIYGKYISLPSQACQNKIAIVEKGKILFKTF